MGWGLVRRATGQRREEEEESPEDNDGAGGERVAVEKHGGSRGGRGELPGEESCECGPAKLGGGRKAIG